MLRRSPLLTNSCLTGEPDVSAPTAKPDATSFYRRIFSKASLFNKDIRTFLPFLGWLHLITLRTLKADFLAGLTGAVIVLPQGVAMATIAGLPPEYGLYTAMVPAVTAALFGSSHHLITGPTIALSLVVSANISPLADPFTAEYVARVLALTFMTGVIQLCLGFARLGGLVNFVSHSVVIGFTAGAGILIGTSQIGNFTGIAVPGGLHFVEKWWYALAHILDIHFPILVIATATLLTVIWCKRRFPRQPGMLYAMIVGSLLAQLFGGEGAGIELVGSLPRRLPDFTLPFVSMETVSELASGALALAMLGLAEAVSIARSVATHTRQHINTNQEFIGQGLANFFGSFFSSYPASGSFVRTGVNFAAGASTPLAAVFSAVLLGAILLLVAPLTGYLPIAAMAGILMHVAFRLIDFDHIRTIMRTSRSEFGVLAVTFAATLLFKLEFAIYVGVLLSLLFYLNKAAHPDLVTLAPNEMPPSDDAAAIPTTAAASPCGSESCDCDDVPRAFTPYLGGRAAECPQIKVIRLDGEIFFGAVNHIMDSLHRIIQQSPEQCHILIVGEGINFIDVAGCDMLSHEGHSLRLNGRQLYLCSLKPGVETMLRKAGVIDAIGEENIFLTKHDAIEAVTHRLDPQRCRHCTVRIFHECDNQPKAELALY